MHGYFKMRLPWGQPVVSWPIGEDHQKEWQTNHICRSIWLHCVLMIHFRQSTDYKKLYNYIMSPNSHLQY